MTEAEKERAAIVAWLRGILREPMLQGIGGEYRRGHDDAISISANCLEAGDHLQETAND